MERDGDTDAKDLYEKRYTAGQKLYLKEAKPIDQADIVIDNSDFENPSMDIIKDTNT